MCLQTELSTELYEAKNLVFNLLNRTLGNSNLNIFWQYCIISISVVLNNFIKNRFIRKSNELQAKLTQVSKSFQASRLIFKQILGDAPTLSLGEATLLLPVNSNLNSRISYYAHECIAFLMFRSLCKQQTPTSFYNNKLSFPKVVW